MSYLIFNKDDHNCKRLDIIYNLEDVRLKYIGETSFDEDFNRFRYYYIKFDDPITLTDRFVYIFPEYGNSIYNINGEYFIKLHVRNISIGLKI